MSVLIARSSFRMLCVAGLPRAVIQRSANAAGPGERATRLRGNVREGTLSEQPGTSRLAQELGDEQGR
jgi:hypothetical protein